MAANFPQLLQNVVGVEVVEMDRQWKKLPEEQMELYATQVKAYHAKDARAVAWLVGDAEGM